NLASRPKYPEQKIETDQISSSLDPREVWRKHSTKLLFVAFHLRSQSRQLQRTVHGLIYAKDRSSETPIIVLPEYQKRLVCWLLLMKALSSIHCLGLTPVCQLSYGAVPKPLNLVG